MKRKVKCCLQENWHSKNRESPKKITIGDKRKRVLNVNKIQTNGQHYTNIQQSLILNCLSQKRVTCVLLHEI